MAGRFEAQIEANTHLCCAPPTLPPAAATDAVTNATCYLRNPQSHVEPFEGFEQVFYLLRGRRFHLCAFVFAVSKVHRACELDSVQKKSELPEPSRLQKV